MGASREGICVIGSAVMDLVFHARRLPVPGETLLGESFNSYPGGKGANQAVAIARLGGDVFFAGCVGRDSNGEALRNSLVAAGVDITHLRASDTQPSGCAAVVVDSLGNNQIVVSPGANMELSPHDVRAALASTKGPVLLQLEIPDACVREAVLSGRTVFLNPAPAKALDDDVLTVVHALTPNELETETLVGVRPENLDACRLAAKRLLAKGVRNVVITLGERGSFWSDGNDEALVAAPSVSALDTVGAGDAFSGALVLFRSQGYDWKRALELANHAAALSVTRNGAQASMATFDDLRQFCPTLTAGRR